MPRQHRREIPITQFPLAEREILEWPVQAHVKANGIGVLLVPFTDVNSVRIPGKKGYGIYLTWGTSEISVNTRVFLGIAYETPDGPQFESAASLNRDESAGK